MKLLGLQEGWHSMRSWARIQGGVKAYHDYLGRVLSAMFLYPPEFSLVVKVFGWLLGGAFDMIAI